MQCKFCLSDFETKPRGGGLRCCPDCSQQHRLTRNFRHGLWRYYRMTLEEYDALRVKQNSRCAICNRHESNFKRRLAVDYNHATKRNRGLLCGNCNTALGKLNEDLPLFEKAIVYLKSWS